MRGAPAVLVLLAAVASGCSRSDAEPPVMLPVPAVSLVDQTGAPFPADKLRGKPWVANFIFTRCDTVCPMFTAKMQRLAQRAPGVTLVSFSVDPEHDTPAVLTEYARKHGAAWTFLTGKIDDVTRTVVDGLKIVMDKQPNAPPGKAILHGTHFVLVDAELRIRGYYDANDDAAIDRLLADHAAVLRSRR
jgi:protein SCO1